MRVKSCSTTNYHGYNVGFSLFLPELLACSVSNNYGLTGPGALLILCNDEYEEKYSIYAMLNWPDAIFDLSWSTLAHNYIASCSGDGTVQIWNIMDPKMSSSVFVGHSKEIYGIDWCKGTNSHHLLSASADESIRLWDVNTAAQLYQFAGHEDIVYSVKWSPHINGIFATVGGDSNLRLWDVRSPDMLPQVIPAHNGDALTCDWDLLNEHMLATGGVDSAINIWDLRDPVTPVISLLGHELAVRRIKFSPFHRNILASVSYDFSTRLWDCSTSSQIETLCYHTEFVYGVDFSPHTPDKFADCGWDSLVQVYEDIDYQFI